MKKIFKFLAYLITIILLLSIILAIVAKLSENKIADIALKKVSDNIEAPVLINDVSFSLIRKFPLATIELNNVVLGTPKSNNNNDSSEIVKDTIVNIQKLYVSVKSKALIKSIIDIKKVEINGAVINYLVDTTGKTNIDFLISSEEPEKPDTSESKPIDLTLTDLSLKNITCNYNDSLLNAAAKVYIPEIKVDAKLDSENIMASVKGNISLSNCKFNNTNLCLMQKTDIEFNAQYKNDSIGIKNLSINTDGAKLNILGSILLHDHIKVDASVKGNEINLNELIKYAPKELLNKIKLNKIAGKLNFDAIVQGIYSDIELPQINANINFQEGNIAMADYPELKNIFFKGNLTNGILKNNESTQADFSSFYFETEKSKFNLAFSVLDIDHPKYNIKTDATINIQEFTDFIPDSLLEYVNGEINAHITTKGELLDSIGNDFVDYVLANTTVNIKFIDINSKIDSSLSIQNFSSTLSYNPNNLVISNLNISIPEYNLNLVNSSLESKFKGSINDLTNFKVDLKSYDIQTKQSRFYGKAVIENINQPTYDFYSDISLNLNELKPMLPDTLLNTLSGNILTTIHSKGTLNLDSISDQVMTLFFKNTDFKLVFDHVSVELPNDPLYQIKDLNGNILVTPEDIRINKLNGIAAETKFSIDSTQIWNTYETLIQEANNKTLTVQTHIAIDEINNKLLGQFINSDTTELKSDSTARVQNTDVDNSNEIASNDSIYLLPNLKELGIPHFLVRGKLAINKIEYEKNIVDNISLKFRFADSLYVIEDFILNTCDGTLNTSLMLDARNWEKPKIDIKNYITSLDVKELLLRNDNFGDTTLTYEKLNGILTSELHFRVFYENGTWPTDRIKAEGHFTLENGKIYSYEPLVELSKNKIIGGLKELDKLDFNTLNTSLFMYKDKIYIPKTDIVTSSMDITAFAMNDLNGDYEYHLEVHLGDVLTGKNNDLMKKQEKHYKKEGETYDRSGGVKLFSSKYDNKKKNGFDSPKKEKEFSKKLNKQKGWLKLFFNPLLVNFSTDLDRTARNKELIEEHGKTKN